MHYELIGYMPDWLIDNVFIWYLRGYIHHDTLLNAMNWLLENTLNITNTSS